MDGPLVCQTFAVVGLLHTVSEPQITILEWKRERNKCSLLVVLAQCQKNFEHPLYLSFFPLSALVFCYQNCSDLQWEKNVLVIEKKFCNSMLKAKDLQKFWHHWDNLFKQWKIRTIIGNRMLFSLVPGGFSHLID